MILFALLLANASCSANPIIERQSILGQTEIPKIDADSILGQTNNPALFFSRGCCSHHGGPLGCNGGRVVCADGTYSPTCGC